MDETVTRVPTPYRLVAEAPYRLRIEPNGEMRLRAHAKLRLRLVRVGHRWWRARLWSRFRPRRGRRRRLRPRRLGRVG
jgi:hypothetical protein